MQPQYRHLLIVSFIIVATVASIVQLQKGSLKSKANIKSKKEIEFRGAKIVEVDEQRVKSTTHAKRIYKTKERFVLFDVAFQNDYQDFLSSQKAIYRGIEIYFYQDVKFRSYNGFTYYTNQAVYNRGEDTLKINERFKAVRDQDIFYGKSMVYYSNRGYIDANRVDSILSLENK